jgi:hypothetical protein
MKLSKFIVAAFISVFSLQVASANEYEAPLTDLANSQVKAWLNDAVVVDAIKAQNAKNAGLSQGDIDALDKQWRAETGASSQPMIEETLANALSAYLAGKKDASQGLFTEIFVMDNKGLNVGQSDVTSDYWQGDEGKWKNTFSKGAGAIDIGDVEQDESTQTFQSQLSIAIDDGGTVIGAITIGVNVEMLGQ